MDLQTFWTQISSVCIDIALRLAGSVLIFIAGKIVIKIVVGHFPKGTKSHPLDPTVRHFLSNFTKIVLYVIVVVSIIGVLGVQMASIVTVLASAGVAVSLALQGSLSNLSSGLMILVFKPYRIGDYIECNDKKGTVIDVGIFYTIIKTDDGKQLHIPNSLLTSVTVINYFSGSENRRADMAFTVAYGSDIEGVKSVIKSVLEADSRVFKDPPPFVRMTELGDSAMKYTVRVWCSKEDFAIIKVDLTEKITEALNTAAIEIPFPQMDVHVK